MNDGLGCGLIFLKASQHNTREDTKSNAAEALQVIMIT